MAASVDYVVGHVAHGVVFEEQEAVIFSSLSGAHVKSFHLVQVGCGELNVKLWTVTEQTCATFREGEREGRECCFQEEMVMALSIDEWAWGWLDYSRT